MEDLDYGITPNKSSLNNEDNLSPIENKQEILFNNPLYSKAISKVNDEDEDENYDLSYLARNYKRVLVACLIGDKTINNLFYKKIISKELYKKETRKLILFPVSLKILKNVLHLNNTIQVDSEKLEELNHMALILEKKDKDDNKHISYYFRSFPSGRAALSIYCLLFAFYLNNKLIIILNLIFTFIINCTVILSNRHHPKDIYFGFFLGYSVFNFTNLLFSYL